MLPVSDADYAVTARTVCALATLDVLAHNPDFLRRIERVKDGELSPDQDLPFHRDGRSRRVLCHVIESAADSPWPDPRQAVLGLPVMAWTGGTPQWLHNASSLRRTAEMLANLCAGRCLYCATLLARDGRRRRYCGAHEPTGRRAAALRRSDDEAMRRHLNAAADAFGVP